MMWCGVVGCGAVGRGGVGWWDNGAEGRLGGLLGYDIGCWPWYLTTGRRMAEVLEDLGGGLGPDELAGLPENGGGEGGGRRGVKSPLARVGEKKQQATYQVESHRKS